ncbi:hypothetical protein HPB50_008656 [Hyalomma asiaticum]|uniref:Uncharacterized protein n=1 Tax=Hyalomma asiaticum TaxID=266040 RepID=A0ACB7S5A4_HYAAI|nr:hypothetical protein HPB50_008656 [Hyalomma asiaticum]
MKQTVQAASLIRMHMHAFCRTIREPPLLLHAATQEAIPPSLVGVKPPPPGRNRASGSVSNPALHCEGNGARAAQIVLVHLPNGRRNRCVCAYRIRISDPPDKRLVTLKLEARAPAHPRDAYVMTAVPYSELLGDGWLRGVNMFLDMAIPPPKLTCTDLPRAHAGPPLQEPSASLTSTSMAHPVVLGRRISVFIIMILCLTVACEALPQGKRAEALLRPVAGGRVVVHAASPLPEMAYVKQRPFRDSLRVKKNGGAERFFDKDVDAFFVNND